MLVGGLHICEGCSVNRRRKGGPRGGGEIQRGAVGDRDAPPGGKVAPVPLSIRGAGKSPVKVGLTTFRMAVNLPVGDLDIFSCWVAFSDPGAVPCQMGSSAAAPSSRGIAGQRPSARAPCQFASSVTATMAVQTRAVQKRPASHLYIRVLRASS